MISVLVALSAVVVTYVLWKVAVELYFWRRTNVKFIGFWEVLKYNYGLFTQPITDQTLESYKRYGRVYGTYAGTERALLIGDPDVLKNIFIKHFNSFSDRFKIQKINNVIWDKMLMNMTGEEWKHVRATMTPSLSSGKLKQMVKTVMMITDNTVESILEFVKKDGIMDVKKIYGAFSLNAIARLAFAVDLNSHKDMTNPFVTHAKEAFAESGGRNFFLATLFPWYFKVMRKPAFPQYVIDFYDAFTRTVINNREKDSKENVTDFLQLLLDTQKKLQEKNTTDSGSLSEKEKAILNVFDLNCISAQSILFFVAAYDTTGSSLSFISYELALNQDVQDKLIKEIDEEINTEEDITYEKISQMPYLEAVINENFRKNTISPKLFRLCLEDVTIGDIHIQKGTSIHISAHGMHNDPEFFPEPEKFNPDRFLPENKANLVPFSFIPFGEGPRHCIGMRLALMELKIALIKILKKVRFERCPETEVPLRIQSKNFLINTEAAIKLKVVSRV